MPAPEWNSLVEVALRRAAESPERILFTFLQADGGKESLTAREFDTRTRALAAALQQRLRRGDRVVLLLPPGIDYIVAYWGCLYAGVISIPAYPPDPAQLDRTLPRLGAILKDSSASAILTTEAIRGFAREIFEERLGIPNIAWLATEETAPPGEWKDPGLGRGDLAFLQYTSGSTRDPRGVMLSHGNILENMRMALPGFQLDSTMTGFLWLPPYHDMGLFSGIVQPVLTDFTIMLMSPIDFLRHPIGWLEVMSEHRLKGSGAPNFAFDLCVRKITPEVKERLDLSAWSLAFSGAEPVRIETLRRFADEFAPCGFRPTAFLPCYGLAEATVMVSTTQRGAGPHVRSFNERSLGQHVAEPVPQGQGSELVSAGHTPEGLDLRIINPETLEPCPPNRVGEIWVSGPNVALGYWGKKEETEAVFGAQIKGGDGRHYLRTGDLGFLLDGHLFVTGRVKDLIIVAGVNYYPQDIEDVVSDAHPFIRPGCAAAFGVDRNGSESLVVVTEVRDASREELAEAAQAIRQDVATALGISPVMVAFIPKHALPKTSSGKVRRRATRETLLDGTLSPMAVFEWPSGLPQASDSVASEARAARRDELLKLDRESRREAVKRIVLEAVQSPESPTSPDLDAPIATLGIDSLKTVELLTQLEDELDVVLPMNELLQRSSLRDLIAAIDVGLDEARPKRA